MHNKSGGSKKPKKTPEMPCGMEFHCSCLIFHMEHPLLVPSLVVPLSFMESDGSSGGTRTLSAFTGLEVLFALFSSS